jgi:hypothetical protein
MPLFRYRPRMQPVPLEPPQLPWKHFYLPDPRVLTNWQLSSEYGRFMEEVLQRARSPDIARKADQLLGVLKEPLLQNRVDDVSLAEWLQQAGSTLDLFLPFLVGAAQLGSAAAETEERMGWATPDLIDPRVVTLPLLHT